MHNVILPSLVKMSYPTIFHFSECSEVIGAPHVFHLLRKVGMFYVVQRALEVLSLISPNSFTHGFNVLRTRSWKKKILYWVPASKSILLKGNCFIRIQFCTQIRFVHSWKYHIRCSILSNIQFFRKRNLRSKKLFIVFDLFFHEETTFLVVFLFLSKYAT